MSDNPKTKSVFINQLEGGYTLNLQGNNFYPVKVCVTIEEVNKIITDFFSTPEVVVTPLHQDQLEHSKETAKDLMSEEA